MKYPKFLDSNSNVGIVALSAGVGRKIESFDKSIKVLENNFNNIVEAYSVRVNNYVSAVGEIRGFEFNNMSSSSVDIIINAAGGDVCLECLPYIDFDRIKDNPKWIMGASDPTSVLYTITTGYDVATLYGFNAGSFDDNELHECQKNCLEILKGNLLEQHSFDFCEGEVDFDSDLRVLNKKIEWISNKEEINIRGRIIGGCFDVLRNLIGTPYDHTREFVNKYSDDGIIWYFDVFSMSYEDFYLSLIQMQYAGWFNNIKGVILGRVLFPSGFIEDLNYMNSLKKVFGDIPIITEACIGHVFPKMTIINGSIANVKYKDKAGSISFELV